jgi:hypothetical protein
MRVRCTIRDLLWLASVVALAVGWWLDRQQYIREADVRVLSAETEAWKAKSDWEAANERIKNLVAALPPPDTSIPADSQKSKAIQLLPRE